MTILVDARPVFDPLAGGVTRLAKNLSLALADTMPDVTFTWMTTGMKRPAMLPNLPKNIRMRHLTVPNKLWSCLAMLRLASLDRWASPKPDLLLLSNVGFVGTPKVPYALVVHDLSFLVEPRWFSWRSRLWHRAVHAKQLIKNARWVFAVSETTKRDLAKILAIDPARITVIPLGLEAMPTPAPLLPTLEGKRFCLALGLNDTRKNIACAIEAVKALRENPVFADIELVVTGVPKNTRLPHWVTALRKPNDAALASLQQHAAVFLYPSWYEGFGLPLHEAATFGTPCIASTSSALPETAPEGTLFAPPAKPHLWTAALKMILTHPEAHRTKTRVQNWQSATRIIQEKLLSEF